MAADESGQPSPELRSQFEDAAHQARTDLPSSLSKEVKSQIYGLYKQATEGDVTGSRPSLLQLTAQAKYDAWKKVQGMSKEDAMQQYVALIHSLK